MKNRPIEELEKHLELSKFIKLLLANLNKFKCLFKALIQNSLFVPHHMQVLFWHFINVTLLVRLYYINIVNINSERASESVIQ